MTPDLVIFDCDGVLVDSERLTVAVEARLLTELGWPLTPAEVAHRFVGGTSASMLAEIEAHLGPELTAHFDEVSTAEVHREFDQHLRAVDGVIDVLDALDGAAVPTCVGSSGPHHKLRHTLGLTGLWDRFEGRIYSGYDVPRGKPAPDLFLHAAAQMGVDPARCVVIEDSRFGVQAAIAAGMTAYGFSGGLAPEGSLAAAGAVEFASMAGLGALLLPAEG